MKIVDKKDKINQKIFKRYGNRNARPQARVTHYLTFALELFERGILTFGKFPFAVLAKVESKLTLDVLA